MRAEDLIALRALALRLFAPLEAACASPDSGARLLAELGYIPPTTVTAFDKLGPAITALDELFNAIEALPEEATQLQVTEAGLLALRSLAIVVDGVNGTAIELERDFAGLPILTETDILSDVSRRLSDYLIARLLEDYYPTLSAALNLFGVIETETIGDQRSEFDPTFVKRTIHWDKLPQVLNDPLGMLVANLTSEDEVLIYRVLYFVSKLGSSLGLPTGFRSPDEAVLRAFNDNSDLFARDDADELMTVRFPFTEDPRLATGLDLYPIVDPASGKNTGLALAIRGGAQLEIPLSDYYRLSVKASANLGDGLGIRIPQNGDITFISSIFDSPSELASSSKFGITFSIVPNELAAEDKLLAFGAPDGSHFEISSGSLSFGVENLQGLNIFLEVDLKDGFVSFKSDDADSFVSSLLPAEGIQAAFNLGVGLSQKRGLYFKSGTGLSIRLPLSLKVGPIEVQYLGVDVTSTDNNLSLILATAFSTNIGPISIVVQDIGIEALVKTNPDRAGNFGPLDLSYGFKPPNGLGVRVVAPLVVGGGFLSFDSEKHEYSGVLQLEIAEKISVKAIGLLSTRLPDGSKGYSLVLVIFVEGFTPIQLGFGFALTGIGGLVALNRTFDEDALRSGLKNHTLDSVMFPHDPIRNAPQIISNLNRVFPPAAGHHLFGPMVQIAWGTPPLITAEVGVVLELGARLRLLILAQIAAILPKRDNDLVRLQMDAVGILDFDQGTATLDASLYDSRLLKKFVLTGDMALRLKWEGSPHFALSVGGLHPAFQPPPNFPKLERIAINLSSGDNPRLRCESYFAITSNTVQFGARAELYASAAGFSIQGDIGYDVLIQFDPFFFLAEFHAQLQLKRGSTNLFKVRVEGSLAGPRPLHLKGKATFEILWWDVTIRVDVTLVKGEKPPGPAPIEVLPRLQEALRHPDNWVTRLPQGQRPVVTLNPRPETNEILLHPLGTLTVKETVVPLNMEISRFGQAAPAGDRHFTITSVNIGGDEQSINHVRDFFAPAQFIELTDDEKLSRPSFEQMDAGVTFMSDAIVFTTERSDWLEAKAIEFETWILDKGTNVTESADEKDAQGVTQFYQLSAQLFSRQARFGAAGTSELRRTGKARYRTTLAKHKIAKEGWTIVDRDDLTPQPVAGVEEGRPASYSEAVQELRKLKEEVPARAARLKILRPSELEVLDVA